jgi:ABC-type maltose transport system permease subunit
MTTLSITLLILIYLISIGGAYLFIQKSYYDTMGRWYNYRPIIMDIVAISFPLMNSILAVMYITGFWKKSNDIVLTFFKPNNKY